MGSRAGLDVLEEKKICCFRLEFTTLYHVQRGTLDTSLKVLSGSFRCFSNSVCLGAHLIPLQQITNVLSQEGLMTSGVVTSTLTCITLACHSGTSTPPRVLSCGSASATVKRKFRQDDFDTRSKGQPTVERRTVSYSNFYSRCSRFDSILGRDIGYLEVFVDFAQHRRTNGGVVLQWSHGRFV
jgi:hypothetical protein